MRFFILLTFAIVLSVSAAEAQSLVLEGLIPDQYVGTNNNNYVHGALVIDQSTGLIAEEIITDKEEIQRRVADPKNLHIALKSGDSWDVIYPGLIDLHNHTKQNNLGVWKEARGQFANRFEWRAWSDYKKAVSGNMNPWIGYGKAINCAVFRWSEIQAMSVGTTYLQGPSHCVGDFAIHQVESTSSYPYSQKERVRAPTDLVIPGDMVFVWNTLKPIMQSRGMNYEQALAFVINDYCDSSILGMIFNENNVMSDAGLDILKDQDKLKLACTKKVPLDELPHKFIRYIYWVHKTVAGYREYADKIANGEGAAIITHLSEGRSDDTYNQKEYEVVKLLGLNKKGMNFVHGVGIAENDLQEMAEKQMGLIWSPFSNLLLYNQTLDVTKALNAGVILALGSDWLPTGSKGPLEELKIAREYIEANGLQNSLLKMPGVDSFDEALFKMVTENPAKMINHWQNGADQSNWQNGEDKGGIGTLAKNAMGTIIVTTKKDENPYTNLVAHVWESDINLVVVDGKIQYGNESYLKTAGLAFELLPNGEHDMENLSSDRGVPVLFDRAPKPTKEQEFDFLTEISRYITLAANAGNVDGLINCDFSEPKGFVHQNTVSDDEELQAFMEASGMNLDRFTDIQRLIGVNLMTQSRNRNDTERGDPEFAVEDFAALYTCNDPSHKARITDFISKTVPADRANRPKVFSTKPARMAEDYQ